MTTSAFARANERAAAAESGCVSSRIPFAIDIGRNGIWALSINSRSCSSDCEYAAPLPRIINGRSAFAKSEIALVTDFGHGNNAGNGFSTLTIVVNASSFSIVAARTFAGKSR